MAPTGGCRDSRHYYYGIKFALAAYATLFSVLGLAILCVGVYAEAERQKHKTLEGVFLAPAVMLLLLGATMFGVSFVGTVGSLRDNRALLKAFSCCGGDEYQDWRVNRYHSCNGSGPLACGVPYTCCVRKAPGEVVNTLCGYRTLGKERLELLEVIHVRGCVHAVGLWLKDNVEATAGIVCALLLPQVIGLVMARLYWQKLDDIYSELDTVDFKGLELRDFSLELLDLTGAGWCWCLPKEGGYVPVGAAGEEDEEEEGAGCQSQV
ncbi:tetraspanin-15-like isoform X7 [Struthio camelus]|uniref:tetraspanin-15-like isoform X7 n=1 Tax=Struthio camelus TaxID=8801 RepID=UPI003603C618